ncbi:E3 ubiquitin-protein ligase TRIM47 [Manacus vitellinus]|uniref:E3 ubiquitin-protein ligase TRIM47 n=1 Tax=Manacus vitellinus TaxID=328815 RepID=UPI00115D2068|nr:E3 ubiquitin-protein ligase TRIM47 [Manacus vitellinus]
MASLVSLKLEEKLVCSICLDLFRVPVTLPCGHNFCKRCISDHWHKQERAPAGAEKGYTCPECRRDFEQCPELEKNVTLYSVVELARDGDARGAGAGRCEVAPGELCRQHGRPLELYCEDERRCICCVCIVRQCQGHRLELFEKERSKKQIILKESLEKAQEESKRIERAMRELEEQTRSIKDSSEELKSQIQSKLSHLKKSLEDFEGQSVARIEQEQVVALGRVEENWSLLKDRLDVLSQHRERAQSLLACPDHRTFLQEFPLLPPLESPEALVPVEFDVAHVIKPISDILTGISRLLLEDLPGSGAPKAPSPAGQGPVHPQAPAVKVLNPLPRCQLRAELLKDHRNLTFDPETVNKYLELSRGARKAKHCTTPMYRGQGPRFEPWQVLCTQSYGSGHHYWEVEISSHSVILGVTYWGLPWEQQRGHKFNIGLDGGSWGLQVREDCYLAWHNGQAEKIQEQLYKNLGVSLDYGKGLLSFYGLGERMQLIHSFHDVFTKPLYPVFWLCEGRVVTLCWRDRARAATLIHQPGWCHSQPATRTCHSAGGTSIPILMRPAPRRRGERGRPLAPLPEPVPASLGSQERPLPSSCRCCGRHRAARPAVAMAQEPRRRMRGEAERPICADVCPPVSGARAVLSRLVCLRVVLPETHLAHPAPPPSAPTASCPAAPAEEGCAPATCSPFDASATPSNLVCARLPAPNEHFAPTTCLPPSRSDVTESPPKFTPTSLPGSRGSKPNVVLPSWTVAQQAKFLSDVENELEELAVTIAQAKKLVELIKGAATKEKERVERLFAEASEVLATFQKEVTGFIEAGERSMLGEAEADLHWKEERRAKLAQGKQNLENVTSTDTIYFLQEFQALKVAMEEKLSPAPSFQNELNFTKCTQVVGAVKDVLSTACKNQWNHLQGKGVDGLNYQEMEEVLAESRFPDKSNNPACLESRDYFLKFAFIIDLDSDTADKFIQLFGTKGAKRVLCPIPYPESPTRFINCEQVLGLNLMNRGNYYWEVELIDGWVSIGVIAEDFDPREAYNRGRLGRNDRSCCLQWNGQNYVAWFGGFESVIQQPFFQTIGVFLEYSEKALTFYGVKDSKMTCLQQLKVSPFTKGKADPFQNKINHHFGSLFSCKLKPAFFLESVDAHLQIGPLKKDCVSVLKRR